MIFEVGSTMLMGGLAGYAFYKSKGLATNDAAKIQRIFNNAGMTIKEGGRTETIRLQRKRRFEGGFEYVYQLPLGLSSKHIMDNKHVLEDGLNVRSNVFEFNLPDLKELKFDKTLVRQIKKLLAHKRKMKEIEIEFDGMLKIKVYNEPMNDKIAWSENLLVNGSWAVPVGYTRQGKLIKHDFDKSKHLIVAGTSGYGKSVMLKMLVATLISQQPDNVELSLIDLKGGASFQRYKECKQTKHYSRDPETAKEVLKAIQEDMNSSFLEIVDNGYEDVKEAGIKKRNFIIIDEAADLADYKEAMKIITDIARRGRSAGYYLVFCTQNPTAEVISSQTKRNIISRLCYVVDTDTASRVVLDEGGANKLPAVPGRGIYKNGVKRSVVQTPLMTNSQIKEHIAPHINIRGRDDCGQKSSKATEDRKYSLEFEEL